MNKCISMQDVPRHVKSGMTVMVGGFMGTGGPNEILRFLAESDVSDLTLICNDTAFGDFGIAKMVERKKFKKIIGTHIGLNAETVRQLNDKEIEVELIPQGTFAERIRAGGAGLGGFLTPTGIGTVIEEGKQKIAVNGREYLLELPLRADVALLFGNTVDRRGNIRFHGSTQTFNIVMATAADRVIVEAEKLVDIGGISPDDVHIPHLFVDYIVEGVK
ncbi:CoA transferase subunit A [Oscillospiraceae bacterium OttesenSCG-928-G22]|nr:CoA transferase subunit A [Oscillospiraceae bacterium OttesenSCG-928-G22]